MDLTEPLTLPSAPEPASRPPIPKLAALVPIAAGVVLWTVTGSLLALCFAALGPLMMLASFADGSRQRRREQKKAEAETAQQWQRADAALVQRQRAVRESLRRRHPDLRSCLEQRPLSERGLGATTTLVLGRGEESSGIRVSGGEGERPERFRARAAVIAEAPMAVALGGGVCIRGPLPVASAVARALVVQLCTRFRAGQLALVGEGVAGLGLDRLPQARSRARDAGRLAVAVDAQPERGADAVLCVLPPEHEVPEGVSTVIDCTAPALAQVRRSDGVRQIEPDALSYAQARRLAAEWTESEGHAPVVPDTLTLAELPAPDGAGGLAALFARGEQGDAATDLVADGPHAIVTGMTGAGKSELLISWVCALAAVHAPEAVAFVLADFKGGTAFDPLRVLPHVAAVITDLDEEGAQRGVQSLRAELRRREQVLAAARARDIDDPAVSMPRLVIVVDEFAALLHEHPDLGEVFTDIAARGRALGMHLILGTQRAGGVIREALAANCPLRISLRVADAADSRMVIGTGDAAELPGDPSSRGLAILRRPRDHSPHLVRIALTRPEDLTRIRERWAGAPRARSPWLPALPAVLPLAEARGAASPDSGDALVLGIVDDPAQQRQHAALLRAGKERGITLFGGPQSGKSTLLALLAEQEPRARVIGPDPESAWDEMTALADGRSALPPLVMIDDLDALIGRFPADYAHAFAERAEHAVRALSAAGATAVITASRVTAPIARIADLLPRRGLLALPSRADHLSVGGASDSYLARRGPGRAHLDGHEVQFAQASRPLPQARNVVFPWVPAGPTAIVDARPQNLAERLRAQHPHSEVVLAQEADAGALTTGARVIVGDGEGWQRQWALWQRLRSGADVVVSAECAPELRTLLNLREPPPYARAHAGRAWLFSAGRPAQRVLLGEPSPPTLRP